ncbi:MAG: hypothetical protein GC136_06290 [Alphaproteobacteria bacterium]|nr:hypothetical protein [Alphaproteobacteria bacterium]
MKNFLKTAARFVGGYLFIFFAGYIQFLLVLFCFAHKPIDWADQSIILIPAAAIVLSFILTFPLGVLFYSFAYFKRVKNIYYYSVAGFITIFATLIFSGSIYSELDAGGFVFIVVASIFGSISGALYWLVFIKQPAFLNPKNWFQPKMSSPAGEDEVRTVNGDPEQ